MFASLGMSLDMGAKFSRRVGAGGVLGVSSGRGAADVDSAQNEEYARSMDTTSSDSLVRF